MPGDGTRTGITTNSPTARCLDLTRLISRVGRGPMTGVDRVEFAYLTHLLDDDLPFYALAKTVLGYVLLDADGAHRIRARLTAQVPWGKPDVIGALSRKATPAKRRAEADLRRFAVARCRRGGLAAMLRRSLPVGCTYLNVGHSNLTDPVLAAWRAVPDAQISVLVHDMIPLDYPQFQRAGTEAAFEAKMKCVARSADLVICNSRATEADVQRWMTGWGVCPQTLVAHLGVEVAKPTDLPADLALARPYFVTLGTIEPRKNHALLLDVWQELAAELPEAEMPALVIAGSRGWNNENVFRRLDMSDLRERLIFERAGLGDGAVSALIAGSAGVLFPSLAEGYGLPPAEAILLGAPVICTDLPVYREILGNIPVYAESADVYLWKQSIVHLLKNKRAGQTDEAGKNSGKEIPTWRDHFNLVLKKT